jgi:hypothetical protein
MKGHSIGILAAHVLDSSLDAMQLMICPEYWHKDHLIKNKNIT